VTLGSADPRLVLDASSAGSRWNPTAHTLTFDSTNWHDEVTVTVSAQRNNVAENRTHSIITHTADHGFASDAIGFDVVDGDSAGVFIDESNGSTLVVRDNPRRRPTKR